MRSNGGSSNQNSASFSLFDRFIPKCPADIDCIAKFDASLVADGDSENQDSGKSSIWAAVYRSSNNKPSVFVKDEFLDAMRIATSVTNPQQQQAGTNSGDAFLSEQIETSVVPKEKKETPVAIARLRPSPDFEGKWIMDSMRCLLKKEDTDSACDGGSEHTEALSVAIDALLLHHLQNQNNFEGAIRTKATLVTGILLESRGFKEVESLSKDMATHMSSLDACTEKYMSRIVDTTAKNPGATERALQIVNHLGRLDRDSEMANDDGSEDEDDDYDPWAGVTL